MKRTPKDAGFTLIEMLVVIAIVGILLTVVLFNYRGVESKSILKNIAYEVALTVREAQSYGLGVKKYVPDGGTINASAGIFSQSYGVHVNDGADEAKNIYLFSDANDNGVCADCTGGSCPGTGECRQTLTLHSGAEIQNVCLTGRLSSSSVEEKCMATKPGGITGLSFESAAVRFKRPNPDAKFTPGNDAGDEEDIWSSGSDISAAEKMVISLINPRTPDYVQNIEITSLGQVSVYGNDI